MTHHIRNRREITIFVMILALNIGTIAFLISTFMTIRSYRETSYRVTALMAQWNMVTYYATQLLTSASNHEVIVKEWQKSYQQFDTQLKAISQDKHLDRLGKESQALIASNLSLWNYLHNLANYTTTLFLDLSRKKFFTADLQASLLDFFAQQELERIEPSQQRYENMLKVVKILEHWKNFSLSSSAFTKRLKQLADITESEVEQKISQTMLFSGTVISVVTLITAGIYLALLRQKRQHEQLRLENLRMTAELDVARRLQELALPSARELQAVPELLISGSIRPADEVGGDYYDVLQYHDACHIGIGDVTGHGLESGLIMLMAQTAVRTLAAHGETDPARFLNTINRTIYDNVQRMRIERNLTLCLLEYRQGAFTLFGQHEEVLVIRRNAEIERVSTQNLGFPVGMLKDIGALVNTATISLQPGDGIVLYTDGVIEAESATHKLYGLDRLCAVIQANWEHPPDTIRQAVLDDVMRHIGTYIVYDDITVVVIKQKETVSA